MIETETAVGSVAMPVTTGRSEQFAIRLPHDHVERVRVLRDALTRPGLEAPSLSEILRAVVAKGLLAWEEELGLGEKPAAKEPPKKKTAR